jgi:hypothetical protein
MSRERVLLIRSGRHLRTAAEALRERFPDCDIAIVGTPGTEQVIGHAGVASENTFIYGARPRFTPLAFNASLTALAARRWRFTKVAVLWNDPDGRGQGNVDRTALGLAPLGFLAITPDGSMVERSIVPQLGYEIRRALMSLAASVVLGALFLPGLAIAGVRRLSARQPAKRDARRLGDTAGAVRDTRPAGDAARALRDNRPARRTHKAA